MPFRRYEKLLLTALLILVTSLTAACAGETTTQTESPVTSATAPIPSPTAQPSAQPTVTPIPSLISVYKPRQTLPDGRLFPEGLFAVLKGEGAIYQVYDSWGHFAYSFNFIQTDGDVNRPVGLYTEDELWVRGYRDTSLLNDPGIQAFNSGFFRISYQDSESAVDLFNRNGQHILTLKNQCSPYEVTVSPYRSGTAVCFAPFSQKTTLYLISESGKIRKAIQTDTNSFALLAEKYLCNISDENEALVSLNGEVIREKVIPIEDQSLYMRGQEMSSFVLVGNYFSEGQTVFDARTLQPVAEDTIDPDIGLIRGLNYNVDGIQCQAYQNNNRGELIAVGYAGNRIAIRTRAAAYHFIAGEDRFYAMNQTMLILADGQTQNFRMLSLATGQEVARIKGFHQMSFADEYIIVAMNNVQNGIPVGFYIIDQEGDIRCISEKSQASESRGDAIILQRGPYVGIADLNGDWLIKALDWEVLRDADFYME